MYELEGNDNSSRDIYVATFSVQLDSSESLGKNISRVELRGDNEGTGLVLVAPFFRSQTSQQ